MVRYSEGGVSRSNAQFRNGAEPQPLCSESREQYEAGMNGYGGFSRNPTDRSNQSSYGYGRNPSNRSGISGYGGYPVANESPATESSAASYRGVRFRDNQFSPASNALTESEKFSRNMSSHVAVGVGLMDDIVEHMQTAGASGASPVDDHVDFGNDNGHGHYVENAMQHQHSINRMPTHSSGRQRPYSVTQTPSAVINAAAAMRHPNVNALRVASRHEQMDSDSQIYENVAPDLGPMSPQLHHADDEEVMHGMSSDVLLAGVVTKGGDLDVRYSEEEGDTSAEPQEAAFYFEAGRAGGVTKTGDLDIDLDLNSDDLEEESELEESSDVDEMQTDGFIEGGYDRQSFEEEYFDELRQ